MKLPDRKETEVRRLLDGGPPVPVPSDLAERALEQGRRVAHRRRARFWLLWMTLLVLVTAFAVWTSVTDPFTPPPSSTTPPLGW